MWKKHSNKSTNIVVVRVGKKSRNSKPYSVGENNNKRINVHFTNYFELMCYHNYYIENTILFLFCGV